MVKSSPWSKKFMDQAWEYRPGTGACPPTPEFYPPINSYLTPCWGDRNYWLSDQGNFHALVRSSVNPLDYTVFFIH